MVARLIINNNSLATDRLFDYEVPDHMEKTLTVGKRVKVPFGYGNKLKEAYVHSLCKKSEYNKLKKISGYIDDFTYFNSSVIEIVEFMRHRYFCSYISALKCFVPSGVGVNFTRFFTLNSCTDEEIENACKHSLTAEKIVSCLKAYDNMSEEDICTEVNKKNTSAVLNKLVSLNIISVTNKEKENIKESTKTFVELSIDREDAYPIIDLMQKKARARARALESLCDNYMLELSELLLYAQCQKSVIDALVEKGYATYSEVSCIDSSLDTPMEISSERKVLTPQQQNAVNIVSPSIEHKERGTFLIHGITGSGKTEVYLELIEKTISCGRSAIFLVPEISLTPQMISQVYSRFGDNAAVLHSKLTLRQRFDQWKRIKNGDVKIAIGARSAVFAPFSDIGLIVVDEEHETSYKSEMSPRYDAVEIARFISRQHSATLLLASATPSLESYYKASNGTFTLIEMPHRANNSSLPEIKITDMRKELEEGNMSIFGKDLQNAIENNLKTGQQSILFLNRRGFAGFVSCRNCGFVLKCPNCNVSLTYHKSNGKMVCHYCDYKTSMPKKCPSCQSAHIKQFGIGTEKIVDELAKLYPKASVLRMDADTTSGRMSHETILKAFGEGKADILVGTQMITKGLDFENVTLVGIVAADMSLSVDDFRAGERTFDLITQVAGRAGRSSKKGYAVIQTYNPDDEIILQSAQQDYKNFYKNEIETRMLLNYPPFTEFIHFVFSSQNQKDAYVLAQRFYNELIIGLKYTSFSGVAFKPCEAPVFKINSKYRYHFILKTPYKKDIYNFISKVYQSYASNKSNTSVTIAVNPNSMY